MSDTFTELGAAVIVLDRIIKESEGKTKYDLEMCHMIVLKAANKYHMMREMIHDLVMVEEDDGKGGVPSE